MNPLNPLQNEDKTPSETPNLSDEQKSAQKATVVILMFFLIMILLIGANYLSRKGEAKKTPKDETDDLIFKKDLAKQYSFKTKTLVKLLVMVCPDSESKEIVKSDVKKLPEETVHFLLGVPEAGKDYSKAALAQECCVSRNTLHARLKKVEWPDTHGMVSREQYKTLRVLPPHVFEMLKLAHDLSYPALAAA